MHSLSLRKRNDRSVRRRRWRASQCSACRAQSRYRSLSDAHVRCVSAFEINRRCSRSYFTPTKRHKLDAPDPTAFVWKSTCILLNARRAYRPMMQGSLCRHQTCATDKACQWRRLLGRKVNNNCKQIMSRIRALKCLRSYVTITIRHSH